MCVEYGFLIFGVAFFGGMSALIIKRARQQRRKAERASALASSMIGGSCNSD